jgi:hypothetical protein
MWRLDGGTYIDSRWAAANLSYKVKCILFPPYLLNRLVNRWVLLARYLFPICDRLPVTLTVGVSYTDEENIRIAAWVDHDGFHCYHYVLTLLESFDDKDLCMKLFRQVTYEWLNNLRAILLPWLRYAASCEGTSTCTFTQYLEGEVASTGNEKENFHPTWQLDLSRSAHMY